jgi:hypothetical protein
MKLATLQRHDQATANAILAAAVLANSANSGLPEDVKRITAYEGEVQSVLAEIRTKLNLESSDATPRTQAKIVDYLSSAIDAVVFETKGIDVALQRIGQLGLLSPKAYDVEQPETFKQRFYSLTMSKKLVRDSIGSADEVQHLMTESARDNFAERDAFSLFLKKMVSNRGEPHWLLIQTTRVGMKQVLQAAWRVFPSEVDLSKAQDPKGVLSAFVELFGLKMKVGNVHAKFIDRVQFPKGNIEISLEHAVGIETFFSWSSRAETKIENISEIGIAYGIDLNAYKVMLRKHGYPV